MANKIRVGFGYDVHALVTGRQLMLGGVSIPYSKGLSGWSDADVLLHALMDALLGAAALGDIGTHFPPGVAEYKNISSLTLLGKVKELLDSNHYKIGNVDIMVMAEEPKLKDFKPYMVQNVAQALGIPLTDISIKAGTNEKLGFVGRGEGIAVQAVALIEKDEK
jgi:2-C-methyl-D-erythritol 2,4-cyclodiphosphate synthase